MTQSGEGLVEAQREHWEQTYRAHPGMYGDQPSEAARYAVSVFDAAGVGEVLELGCGHGRDALFLARSGFQVRAIDFSAEGVRQLDRAADVAGLSDRVRTGIHDVRDPIPVPDAAVDGVFAHMLLCMALSTEQITAVVGEVRRVLRPGGVFIYTVRHAGDTHFGAGITHGDDIYQHGGFAVHFFTEHLVQELAEGWNSPQIYPFGEGALPRRLWRITQTLPI